MVGGGKAHGERRRGRGPVRLFGGRARGLRAGGGVAGRSCVPGRRKRVPPEAGRDELLVGCLHGGSLCGGLRQLWGRRRRRDVGRRGRWWCRRRGDDGGRWCGRRRCRGRRGSGRLDEYGECRRLGDDGQRHDERGRRGRHVHEHGQHDAGRGSGGRFRSGQRWRDGRGRGGAAGLRMPAGWPEHGCSRGIVGWARARGGGGPPRAPLVGEQAAFEPRLRACGGERRRRVDAAPPGARAGAHAPSTTRGRGGRAQRDRGWATICPLFEYD